MKQSFKLALASLLIAAVQAHSQSVTFDFQDNTDQGFGAKFSNDASETFSIVNIGGSLRMAVLRDGGFQEADHGSGANPFLAAANAAVLNPTGYVISYDWYVDTSLAPGTYGNFLQIGTYFNSGGGGYVQDFPTIKDVELNGTQLASGSVFSGTVSETITTKYGALPGGPTGFDGAQTFMRLGFILNGDGAAVVYFDNISITPVPEPSTLALLALAGPAFWMMRRRNSR